MSVRQTINKPSSSPSSAMEEEMPSVVAPELSTIQPEQSTIQPEVPAAKWTPAIAPEVVEEAHEKAAPSSEPVSVPKRKIIEA